MIDNGLKQPPQVLRERKGRLRTDELKARLGWIEKYIALNFISPTYDEMGVGWGVSKAAVSETIERMAAFGWIIKAGQSPRSIRLVRQEK